MRTGNYAKQNGSRTHITLKTGETMRLVEYTTPGENGCLLWRGTTMGPLNKPAYRYPVKRVSGCGTSSGKQLVHRLVLEEKVGYILPPEIKACHSCDQPLCINPDHLFPGTQAENLRDCIRKGRGNRAGGERCHFAVLTALDVRMIKAMGLRGWKGTAIGRIFKVSASSIWNILKRDSWKNIRHAYGPFSK